MGKCKVFFKDFFIFSINVLKRYKKLSFLIYPHNSFNHISFRTCDFKVLKRIISGELVRFDIFVIARLCDYLDCAITDIIEYIPNKK